MSRTILIVDDSPAIRCSVRSWIESKTDWKVCGEAEDGKTAVDLVQLLKPDFVILDFAMPGMNGFQAANEIVAANPKTQVVLFTSYPSDLLREHALRVGIKAVLVKDGNGTLDRLVSTIQKLPESTVPSKSVQELRDVNLP